MKFLDTLFGKKSTQNVPKGIGDIYTFRTRPIWEFASETTNRFGAFKIVKTNDEFKSIIVFDLVEFGKHPTLQKVLKSKVLVEQRLFFRSQPEPAAMNVYSDSLDENLLDLVFLANTPVKSSETKLFERRQSYGSASSINSAVEGEWRWGNDREKFEKEYELYHKKQDEIRAAEDLRFQTRLKGLTWDKLEGERYFSHWTLPPVAFTVEAQELISNTITEFRKFPGRATKKVARKILLGAIAAFNSLDHKYDNPIETEEREDIMSVIDEIAYVAKHRDLVAEADKMREF